MTETYKDGGCRCGTVRFRVKGRPLITSVCHCTGCQKMTSSAFSLSALYPEENFELVQGEPVLGGLRKVIRHYCCPDCKSWLYTQADMMGPLVNVRATMIDDNRDYKPFLETYTCEMLPWAKTPAVRSYEKFPTMDDFAGLIADFAASDF